MGARRCPTTPRSVQDTLSQHLLQRLVGCVDSQCTRVVRERGPVEVQTSRGATNHLPRALTAREGSAAPREGSERKAISATQDCDPHPAAERHRIPCGLSRYPSRAHSGDAREVEEGTSGLENAEAQTDGVGNQPSTVKAFIVVIGLFKREGSTVPCQERLIRQGVIASARNRKPTALHTTAEESDRKIRPRRTALVPVSRSRPCRSSSLAPARVA